MTVTRVGFGLAKVIVISGFRPPASGLVPPSGEGTSDSGLVPFLDNSGVGLGFILFRGDKSKVVFFVPPIS